MPDEDRRSKTEIETTDASLTTRPQTGTVRSRDGTTIAFERSGEGPPLIVVGGALSDRSAGAPLAALLAPRFTVYTYDRRGRGDSGDAEGYTVEREIEDLEVLVAEAGGSAFVFGTSSGAVLALEAAIRGLDVAKLALFEPPFRVSDGEARPPDALATRLEDLLSAGRRGAAVEHFLTTAVEMPGEAVAGMRAGPAWPALEELAPTLVYDVTVVGDGSIPTERSSSATVPTLVMDGGESPAWVRQATRAVAATLPNGHHRTLEGQTHDVAPDVLASAVEEFFAS
jgi:pimeloyl-ACP methyl ester carboxylesterase